MLLTNLIKAQIMGNCLQSSSYLTSSTVSAGSFITSVDHLDLTVSAGEADGTGAGVVLASVEARGAVVAGSVVGAEVEIFVAHLSSPALLTLTCPGLGTRPVDTAWVDLTLLTSVSLPALVTTEKKIFR